MGNVRFPPSFLDAALIRHLFNNSLRGDAGQIFSQVFSPYHT
jgi:hypothetical protein